MRHTMGVHLEFLYYLQQPLFEVLGVKPPTMLKKTLITLTTFATARSAVIISWSFKTQEGGIIYVTPC